ncbi:unnamed protein product, partial [Staurois parvus]
TLGTVQSEKYRSPGNHQTQTCPSDCQTEKCDKPLQRTRFYCSRAALESSGSVLYTTASDTLHCTYMR